MKKLVYQVGQNLFIKDNKVISYETHVATIKDDTLYEFGKFSRTTTKHISKVAGLLRLKVQTIKKEVQFWKHEMGVVFTMNDALSPQTSFDFLVNNISSREQILNYIINNREKLPGKDWTILKKFLGINPNLGHPRSQKVIWEKI